MLDIVVNGTSYCLPEIPDERLSDLLRERLHLTGTKIGCGEGHCGMCTVLVDGKPVKSCLTKSNRINGKSILTIEGLQNLWKDAPLHPLQQAFIDYGAIQCGFCTPAQILNAYAYLLNHPDPSYDDLKIALKGVLCRCGGYESILKAVMAAAKAIQSSKAVEPPQVTLASGHFQRVGKVFPRPDAVKKATGKAVFTSDLTFEGMLYARVVRAGVPHAVLNALEMEKARKLPGVRCLMTAADLPAAKLHGLFKTDWPILVGIGEKVRYVGDAVALIAADTQQIADEAANLVSCEWEPLPIVSNPYASLAPNAPVLHPDGNVLKHIMVRKGDTAQGFAESDLILEHTFQTPFTDHFFMEPECSIAVPLENGRMDIYVGSQIPYADRKQVAAALGLTEEQVRIRGQITGGGFGGKEDIAGQIHSALLAQATNKPVKLLFTRRESLLVHPKRHATSIHVKLGAMHDGTLIAAETELFGDTGAYASLGEKVMTRATTHSTGPYIIPHVKADCYAMYTNNPPAGAFRGFGVLQSAFAVENMMDMLAHQLGMDPIALRKKNSLVEGSRTNTNQLMEESVGLLDCLKAMEAKLTELAGPEPFKPVTIEGDGEKFVTCWGVAAAYKNTGLGSGADDSAGADVELLPDGRVQVRTASAEIGQGLVTTLRIIVAEVLERDPKDIDVLVMDTDLTPDGGPTTASRQTYVCGNAALMAAKEVRERIQSAVAFHWDIPDEAVELNTAGACYREFSFSWSQIAKLLEDTPNGRTVRFVYHAPETYSLNEGSKIHFAYSFSAQAVQIEVSMKDGRLKVLQVISANDSGRVINPLGFQGQVEGGVVMGVGHALMEEFRVHEGIIETDRIARYKIPTFEESPKVISLLVEHPTKDGPFGAKGVGEIVSIPTPPAIANALYNAIGMRADSLPIQANQILEHLRNKAQD